MYRYVVQTKATKPKTKQKKRRQERRPTPAAAVPIVPTAATPLPVPTPTAFDISPPDLKTSKFFTGLRDESCLTREERIEKLKEEVFKLTIHFLS